MFMSLAIPATAPEGIHEIELFLPPQDTRGPVCSNESQNVSRLATTTVTIQE